MKCLYCGEQIRYEANWGSLLAKEVTQYMCSSCKQQLIPITGECCARCARPFAFMDPSFRYETLCYDCVRWEQNEEWGEVLMWNRSAYFYNDFLKEMVARYKFRGDYVLAKIFATEVRSLLKEVSYDSIVPIPLSKERLYERGFNQAEALIVEAGLSPSHCLSRIHSEKQSKKSREERIHLPQVFQLEQDPRGKRIILVDDIYTTGSTLMHAAKLLKDGGAQFVASITIGRG